MGGINVPFLVRWPGFVPAGRVDKTTALAGVDVFLTLLAACEVATPNGYVSDGENMLSAWKGQPTDRTKPVYWWWQGKHTGDDWPAWAMRDGPWVLILDESKQRVELYDVVADRTQANNLADKHPDRVAKMRMQLDTWQDSLPNSIDTKLQTTTAAKKTSKPATANLDRGAIFARWDTNGDEVLSWDEYRNGLSRKDDAERRFKTFDKDRSGTLQRDEFVNPSGN
jgi:N-acetylgalactosamine-6-sulfatase